MEHHEEILRCESISKRFGGLRALNGIDISVRKGEIFGIVGPNGAGKTTLFNIISGVLKPTTGKIYFNGNDITHLGAYKRAKLGIGRTFQVVRPFGSLSVIENVAVAYGSFYYFSLTGVLTFYDSRRIRQKLMGILERVGLASYAEQSPHELPLGLQRRLEIARALALEPQLLLLDESFSGLSLEEIEQLEELVRNLNASGVTVVIIEHNMPVVMDLCKRVAVISYGDKIAEGSPDSIVNNPDVVEAYLGKKPA